MEKVYKHQEVEGKIYQVWEEGGYFQPKIDKNKKPFTILLPLPNANDPIHMGHCLFTVQDIMIRYHRMLGDPTLWLPGADHAGIETQYVFEKQLSKEGKSRFDFDRDTLFKMIWDFVEKNRNINIDQLKRMGFSLDWTRYHYSMEPEIVQKILQTFLRLHQDKLLYRGNRMVNFCPKCGTAFSELEAKHEEKDDFLYYINYGPVTVSTVRPETIFGDVAVAVNPKDKRYLKLKGISAELPLIYRKLPIIFDEAVDMEFGTGVLKITPSHDPVDFEIAEKHKLKGICVMDRNGRMINVPEKYLGLKSKLAREEVVKDLSEARKLVKTEPLKHTVSVCYRCGSILEPMVMLQWFVQIKPLARLAIEAVKKGKTKIVPKKRFEKMYFNWMENIHDWNISRQIVWGPRIPVWYSVEENPDLEVSFRTKEGEIKTGEIQELLKSHQLKEISDGVQQLYAPIEASFKVSIESPGADFIQETDTFDTWFLSGQWPLTTLGYPAGEDFKYFYPTSVLDTLWDILFFWVARMMMFGLYLAKNVPFEVVHIHARVVDKYGQKMSKSKGNVVNPIEMADKYGADALRMTLIIGVAPASDVAVSEDKIRAMRNFANKIWNAARFILENHNRSPLAASPSDNKDDEWILGELAKTTKSVTNSIEQYRFGQAAEDIYHFFWHTFCDKYLEMTKTRKAEAQPTLLYVLETSLKLLHPFMPFITEELWQLAKIENIEHRTKNFQEEVLITAQWPR